MSKMLKLQMKSRVKTRTEMISNPYGLSGKRKSTRISKKPTLFCDEEYIVKKKSRKKKDSVHVRDTSNKIKNMFKDILDPIIKENESTLTCDKIYSLKSKINKINNLQNPMFTKEGFIITSSDRKKTYTVTYKQIGSSYSLVCNCGNNYKDMDRTTCIHVGLIVLNSFEQYIRDFFNNNTDFDINEISKTFSNFNICKDSESNIEIINKDYFSLLNI